MLHVVINNIPFLVRSEMELEIAVLALRGAWATSALVAQAPTRPRELNAVGYAEEALRRLGKPSTVAEIHVRMVSLGFTSRSPDPTQVIRTILSRSPKFESVGRGLWTLTLENRPVEEPPDDSADEDWDIPDEPDEPEWEIEPPPDGWDEDL